MSASGSTAVAPFMYTPATTGKVKPNQIRNTAIGDSLLEQSIDIFVRDAIFKELRFVGVNVADQSKKLSGEIQEFLMDDLGFNIDWTLIIKYTVRNESVVMFESVKAVKRQTTKLANVFGALNETIKLNVEELIKDPDFVRAIN